MNEVWCLFPYCRAKRRVRPTTDRQEGGVCINYYHRPKMSACVVGCQNGGSGYVGHQGHTVVSYNDDIDTAVQVHLLQTVHQLTDDVVHLLQRVIQLHTRQTGWRKKKKKWPRQLQNVQTHFQQLRVSPRCWADPDDVRRCRAALSGRRKCMACRETAQTVQWWGVQGFHCVYFSLAVRIPAAFFYIS